MTITRDEQAQLDELHEALSPARASRRDRP
jgi:hypothetical protein